MDKPFDPNYYLQTAEQPLDPYYHKEHKDRKNHKDDAERGMRWELARAYVPFQPYCDVFPLEAALIKGTIFTCLYFPYREKSREQEVDAV